MALQGCGLEMLRVVRWGAWYSTLEVQCAHNRFFFPHYLHTHTPHPLPPSLLPPLPPSLPHMVLILSYHGPEKKVSHGGCAHSAICACVSVKWIWKVLMQEEWLNFLKLCPESQGMPYPRGYLAPGNGSSQRMPHHRGCLVPGDTSSQGMPWSSRASTLVGVAGVSPVTFVWG